MSLCQKHDLMDVGGDAPIRLVTSDQQQNSANQEQTVQTHLDRRLSPEVLMFQIWITTTDCYLFPI